MNTPTDALSAIRPLSFKNSSGEQIPSYAVMRITGYETDSGAFTVSKPNADDKDTTILMVNGPNIVDDGDYGTGTMDFPCLALVGGGSALDECGTVSGSWELDETKKGFRILSTPADGLALVNRGIRFLYDVDCVDDVITGTKPSA